MAKQLPKIGFVPVHATMNGYQKTGTNIINQLTINKMKTENKYPIDRTPIANNRKINGAYVWYRGMLKRITSQNVGNEHVVVANLFKLKRKNVTLAKVGDLVSFEETPLRGLPDRCKEIKFTSILEFRGNDHVLLAFDHDTTHFDHLKKYKPLTP